MKKFAYKLWSFIANNSNIKRFVLKSIIKTINKIYNNQRYKKQNS